MPRSIKTPCRGRKARKCKSASRSCSYATGTKRRFCRKRKNITRKR